MGQEKNKQWDKKAQNYNRYNPDDTRFEAKILQDLKTLGVNFTNKEVLDVGAGTGVYSIRIAKMAKNISAIDFSSQMLEVLKEDATKENLENITTQTTSWGNFHFEKPFDISLCTMSPALDTHEDFEKFDKSAKTKIYLGWAGKRDSDILSALFKAHKQTYKAPNGSAQIKSWLQNNEKSFTCKEIEELKVSTCKAENGLNKYEWHLEIREVTPNEELVKEVLEKFTKDGIITEHTTNLINLIIWE